MPTSARLRRRPAVVALVAAALLGAAGGLVVGLVTPVTYTATGTVFVSTASACAAPCQPPLVGRDVRTAYASVATTPLVLRPVIAELHLHTSVAALAQRISVDEPDGQVLLRIGATDPSAARAERIANAVQDRLVTTVSSLTPSNAKGSVELRAVRRASAAPSGPSPLVSSLGGALAGVLIWAVVVVVLLVSRIPGPPRGTPAPSML